VSRRARGVWLLFCVLGCSTPEPPPADAGADAACTRTLPACSPTPPSYQQSVAPLIQRLCVPCHFPGNTLSSLDFSDYAGVHANYGAMLNQLYACNMPPSDAGQPSVDERELLLTWLVCRAPDN
jgi:hypothetical protein